MENRHGSHTVTRLTVHLVWITKYRYHVLKGEIQKRCRELLIQVCDSEDVRILKGVVSKDHVHMHIEYPPSKSISDLVKGLKGTPWIRVLVISTATGISSGALRVIIISATQSAVKEGERG